MTEKDPTHPPLRFRGRRIGKKLRPGRQRLMDGLLPKLRVPLGGQAAINPTALFANLPSAVWMEIGFGGGEHLAAQAAAHPDIGFIGAEPFINGVASLMAQLDAQGIENVRVHDDEVRPLIDALPDACLDRLFLLFSDPWPKKRHWNRRVASPENIRQFARLLKPGAEFRFATDHMGHLAWALRHLTDNPDLEWLARTPDDWRMRPDDWVPTRYEEKALEKGDACVYLRFQRR